MRRRNIEMRRIRQGIGSSVMNNFIEAHQEAASKADEEGMRFEAMQSRLKRFNKQFKKQGKSSSHCFDWLKEQKHLEKEAKDLSKSISASLSSLFSLLEKEEHNGNRLTYPMKDNVGENMSNKPDDGLNPSATNIETGDLEKAVFLTNHSESCFSKEDILKSIKRFVQANNNPTSSICHDENSQYIAELLHELRSAISLLKQKQNASKREDACNPCQDELNETYEKKSKTNRKPASNISLRELQYNAKNERMSEDDAIHFTSKEELKASSAQSFCRDQHEENDNAASIGPLCAELTLQFRENLSMFGAKSDAEYDVLWNEVHTSYCKVIKLYHDYSMMSKGDGEENFKFERVNDAQLPGELSASLDSMEKQYENYVADITLLRDELAAGFISISNAYHSSLTDARDKFQQAVPPAILHNDDDAVAAWGGWDEKNHAVFVKIFMQYEKSISSSSSGAELKKRALERLQMTLPSSKTKEECLHHWIWYEQLRIRKRKEKDASNAAKRKRVELSKIGTKKIDELKISLEAKMAHDASVAVQDAMRYEQHARLKLLRGAREEAAKAAAERKKREDLEQEKMEKKREHQRREEQKVIKQAVKEFKEKGRRDAEAQKIKQHEEQYLQELERLRRMKMNEDRISYREKLRKDKLQKDEEQAILASQAEEHRLERLSALAASVPYYSAITNITPNLHKTTAARIHDVYEDNPLAHFQQNKMISFSNEKVFSDLRFRLGHALHEAGVAQTPYARAVVKKLVPRQIERTTGIEPY